MCLSIIRFVFLSYLQLQVTGNFFFAKSILMNKLLVQDVFINTLFHSMTQTVRHLITGRQFSIELQFSSFSFFNGFLNTINKSFLPQLKSQSNSIRTLWKGKGTSWLYASDLLLSSSSSLIFQPLRPDFYAEKTSRVIIELI